MCWWRWPFLGHHHKHKFNRNRGPLTPTWTLNSLPWIWPMRTDSKIDGTLPSKRLKRMKNFSVRKIYIKLNYMAHRKWYNMWININVHPVPWLFLCLFLFVVSFLPNESQTLRLNVQIEIKMVPVSDDSVHYRNKCPCASWKYHLKWHQQDVYVTHDIRIE